MRLMTEAHKRQAQKQYAMGSDLEQKIVCKVFDPCGSYTAYIMNQDPNDPDYLWGIVSWMEVEMGSMSLSDLSTVKNRFGLGMERDLHFGDHTAQWVWDELQAGRRP